MKDKEISLTVVYSSCCKKGMEFGQLSPVFSRWQSVRPPIRRPLLFSRSVTDAWKFTEATNSLSYAIGFFILFRPCFIPSILYARHARRGLFQEVSSFSFYTYFTCSKVCIACPSHELSSFFFNFTQRQNLVQKSFSFPLCVKPILSVGSVALTLNIFLEFSH